MFTIEEIARATGGTIVGSGAATVAGVSTDSRTVQADELFVPLKGSNFDGHAYINAAVAKGVRACIADAGWLESNTAPDGITCIAVADTLRALGDLAAFHRGRFAIPVIGVTGSNGKTTTKEMLAAILEQGGPGLKTSGNLNNLIGLPQMLLRLSPQDRWAVLEMGMSEPGEIDRLAELARPQIGIITNAFSAHLESMGSVEAVAAAKGELFRRLPVGGTALFNADDNLVAALPSPPGVARLSFGLAKGEISAIGIKSEGTVGQSFVLHLPEEELPVRMKCFGRHNVYNALAAAAAAVALGVKPQQIRAGLELFVPYDKRFKLEEVNGIVLIDDSYNANPASMEAALVTVRDLKQGQRAIAVLGDMLELGAGAGQAHTSIGRLAASCVDHVIAIGAMAETVTAGAVAGGLSFDHVTAASDHVAVIAELRRLVRKGDYIIVKGSRGMRMETVAAALRRGPAPLPGEEA
jgi:UDP-N-acetylmuramoyl-tripeptide--D-alanyl-D-alanine ligase